MLIWIFSFFLSDFSSNKSDDDGELSTFRRALPQFIAVGVKNVVLLGEDFNLFTQLNQIMRELIVYKTFQAMV